MNNVVIAVLSMGLMSGIAIAADKSSIAKSAANKTTKASESADDANAKPFQLEFIQGSKAAIGECNRQYQKYLGALQVNEAIKENERRIAKLRAELGRYAEPRPDPQPPVVYHANCISEQKDIMMPKAKDFLASFKSTESKGNARAMVAQWITAIDSVGTQVGAGEAAKFETLANGLLIDIQ